MIGRIRGNLLEIDGATVTVEAGGVGYEIQVPESVMMRMPAVGEPVDLQIRQVFREDDVSLYGFLEPFQRKLFDMLRSVKGCGPKIGLALIGQLGEDAVSGAILTQDARALSRASGVGPRLAERIILELKEKMAAESLTRKVTGTATVRAPVHSGSDDLIDALIALGYRRPEAESVVRDVTDEADDIQTQIRLAVARLSPARTGAKN